MNLILQDTSTKDAYIPLCHPAGEKVPSGWVIVKGVLRRNDFGFSARLRVLDKQQREYLYELPVSLKGNLIEILHLPHEVDSLALLPCEGMQDIQATSLHVRPIRWYERYYRMWQRVVALYQNQPHAMLYKAGMRWYTPLLNLHRAYELAGGFRAYNASIPYPTWIERFDELDKRDIKRIHQRIKRWPKPPAMALLIEGGGDPLMNQALSEQLFPVEVVNSGEWSTADWVLCVQNGVVLRPHASYWFAEAVIKHPDVLAVYSDHDLLSEEGERVSPYFKPDWSPELLLADAYVGPVMLVRRSLLEEQFSERAQGPSGLSCYELALACLKSLGGTANATAVIHIPAVLYHWHESAYRTDQQHHLKRLAEVQCYLDTVGANATAVSLHGRYHQVEYVPNINPKVSIIIPTRDTLHHLRRCVDSILAKSSYTDYEIIIVDNQSNQAETLAYFDELAVNSHIRILAYDFPFNYSALNNFAVRHAQGEVILLLNNDTEVISGNWIELMLGQLAQPAVGAVGVKLLFGDGRVQHAGDAVGPGGCADHFHSKIAADDPGYHGRAILAQDLSAVTAACLMVKRSLWQKLNGLDEENLAIAFNDVDFCLRIREAGLRVVYTPYAMLYHHESVSRGKDDTPDKIARAKAEADYIRLRWKHLLSHDPFYNPNLNYARPDFRLSHAPRVQKPWLSA